MTLRWATCVEVDGYVNREWKVCLHGLCCVRRGGRGVEDLPCQWNPKR
eukprot:CAMPEP_0196734926 /NCGR_PEP_ID=MMETSP1091-20130531/13525_1 /TAXON_ID=302021 /ORGANISM="Rhodomonas sp., Strain CCMP768" /LENGTH=47 /DNA_ID= /DNA_START= /DNA_END= /DNA_ORIENTATION=